MKLLHVLFVGFLLAPALAPAQFFPGRRPATPQAQQVIIPLITLRGPIIERRDPQALFVPPTTSVHDIVRTINKAATDPAVRALIVKIEQPQLNLVQAMEIATAMQAFADTGKPLHAYLDLASLGHYLIVASATEIVMPPVGAMDNVGIGATAFFLRDLLGRIGVEAQAVTTGPFKDAFEPFTASTMSDSTREQLDAFIGDVYTRMVQHVMRARDVDEETAEKFISGGPFTAEGALRMGAIDRIEHFEAMRDRVVAGAGDGARLRDDYTAVPRPPQPNLRDLFSLFGGGIGGRTPRADLSEKIAVIHAQGPIFDGRVDRGNPFSALQTIASDDFIDLIDEVSEQPNLKAVVLRIDSPGGSANASDRIWNRLRRLSDEQGIPLVVSMGAVAASGGYYIGMAGDHVFADASTVTGSIGVVGGKISLGGTYDMLGITREAVTRGKNIGLTDESRLWNEEELALMQSLVDEIYASFLARAAESRGKDVDQIRDLAGGRIWSGKTAAEVGLVDSIGGLQDAIAKARSLSGSDTATIVDFPRELTPLELIEQILTGQISVRQPTGVAALWQRSEVQAARQLLGTQLVDTAFAVLTMMEPDRPTVLMVGGLGWDLRF